MFRRLDSFLIDRVFQPVLQRIMYYTGWRKWWLVAQIEIAQFVLWCCGNACLWGETSWPEKIFIMVLGLIWLSELTVKQKVNLQKPNENPGIAPIERLIYFPIRILCLTLFLLVLAMETPLFIYFGFVKNISTVCYLLGGCAWVFSSYFQASATPKPPEKRNEVPNGVFQGS